MLPSFMTCNGMRVATATIAVPRVGVWHADLTVDIDDGADAPSGEVTLETEHRTWRGTVRRGEAWRGVAKLRIVGGKGGMGNMVPPKSYRAAIARLPIADALAASGESLAASADGSTLSRMLPFWTSPSATAAEVVARVCADLGVSWRMLDDGTVWIGADTWPAWELPAKAMVTARWPDEGAVEIADETLSAEPGTTFEGQRVGRVEHRITADGARTVLFFDDRQTQSDTIRQTIARIARSATGVDYLALYRARIVAQNADGTLEVELDDKRMPGMSHVPLRTFLPGVEVRVKSGGHVLVGFESGDPTRPVATLFDGGAIDSLTITAETKIVIDAAEVDLVKSGGRQMAAVGDMVVVTIPPGLVTQGAGSAAAPNTLPLPIYGTITTGSPKRKVP